MKLYRSCSIIYIICPSKPFLFWFLICLLPCFWRRVLHWQTGFFQPWLSDLPLHPVQYWLSYFVRKYLNRSIYNNWWRQLGIKNKCTIKTQDQNEIRQITYYFSTHSNEATTMHTLCWLAEMPVEREKCLCNSWSIFWASRCKFIINAAILSKRMAQCHFVQPVCQWRFLFPVTDFETDTECHAY